MIYARCWQSSGRTCDGGDQYFAKGWRVWRERRHVRTSGGSISIVGNGIAYNGHCVCLVGRLFKH